ncbi:MAG: UDP-N-acetylmuramoyl-L-alanyl-D-glutamate--2,6-diaminopimelate ligase [Desulfobulbus propionicus]|nr:MAG: UDP-N-acetylmuramoyl-L-alanyl-D-glutamate--2,6-diaminopimelate ligase [Desulfobulbus propionicus]
MKTFDSLFQSIAHLSPACQGRPIASLQVRDLVADSRQVDRGAVFVALKGSRCDGHEYLQEALASGCAALVVQEDVVDVVGLDLHDTALVIVSDTHAALAAMAAAWYGYPADGMTKIGITGTNGKTTCTWLIEEMLVACGYKTGVIGTVNYRYRDQAGCTLLQEAPLTTPAPLVLQKTLLDMAENGVTHLLMEVSSHALDQSRIGQMVFDVAVFTNLSRDHLDYHYDMEAYFQTKSTLFTEHLAEGGQVVVVVDEEPAEQDWGAEIAALVPESQVLRCGLGPENDVTVREIRQQYDGTQCTLAALNKQALFTSQLAGRFNLRNMVAAVGVGVRLGLDFEVVCSALQQVRSVPGRLERVCLHAAGADHLADVLPEVFVDYAHTPDALLNVLRTARELTPGRLICVFGCGGDRDAGKRPEMGRVVGEQADLAIVTADNPRTEQSSSILADIVPGLEQAGAVAIEESALWSQNEISGGFVVIGDRARAIRTACSFAGQGDCVVLAGKGHENYQIIGTRKRFFDDRREAVTGLLTWNTRRLLEAVGGRLLSGKQSRLFERVVTDSRTLEEGDIFVALCGEKFDGHLFVDEAVCKGAAAVIVEQPPERVPDHLVCIQVDDTLHALGELARYLRNRMRDRVVVAAVTGSSGKTTVKEMTAAILRQHMVGTDGGPERVLKTRGNWNNLVGVPLSLLPLNGQHDAVILEMGMNSLGEIRRLTEIADPDIGCINNVQAAHLEGLGSIEGVARAKGELFAVMRPEAVRIVNYDDPHCRIQAKVSGGAHTGFAITAAGRRHRPAVRATRIKECGEKGSLCTLQVEQASQRLRVPVPGLHNVSNWVAASAIAWAAGVPFAPIIQAVEGYKSLDNRMMMEELPGGVHLVNDTYNANPASMAAALRTVATFGGPGRKAAVLGDMLELGADAAELHAQVGFETVRQGYDMLAVTGSYAEAVAAGALNSGMASGQVHVFETTQAVATWLFHLIANGVLTGNDWILLKGSRGMRMETIIDELRRQLHHNVE